MSTHTQNDTEVYQIRTLNQTTENAQPEETRKKCPIKVIQTTTRIPLSLSESAHASNHMHCTIFPS